MKYYLCYLNNKLYNTYLQLLNGINLTQSQIVIRGSDKGSNEEIMELANNIASIIPDLFDVYAAAEKYPIKYEQSMNTVIQQVLSRFIFILSGPHNWCSIVFYMIKLFIHFKLLSNYECLILLRN